jgi:hypothetical protein
MQTRLKSRTALRSDLLKLAAMISMLHSRSRSTPSRFAPKALVAGAFVVGKRVGRKRALSAHAVMQATARNR